MHRMDEVSDFVDHVILANSDVVVSNLRPPEFTPDQGTSFKGQLYSLAHTLYKAATYGHLDDDDDDDDDADFNKALLGFIHWLSSEDPAQRPEDVAAIVEVCERNLREPSGEHCQRLSSTVNEDSHRDRKRSSSSSQVLFPRRHSLCSSMSLESLSPADIFNTTTPSASPSQSWSSGPNSRFVSMTDERGSLESVTGEVPLGEASTTRNLENLSGPSHKSHHTTREKQFGSEGLANGTKPQIAERKRFSLMRRANTIASKEFSDSGNSLENLKSNIPAISPQNSLCVHKSLDCEVPSIIVSCPRRENDNLLSYKTVQGSESLGRHRTLKDENSGESPEHSEQSIYLTEIKSDTRVDFRCEGGDEFAGGLEPLSPLCTDDLSILEGNMIPDGPWFEDEDTEPEGHLELKQTFHSNSESLELPSSAFNMNQHSSSRIKLSVKSSCSYLNDVAEERRKNSPHALRSDVAARGIGRKSERVLGTDLAHTSTSHLNKPQDFFDNRRASDSEVASSVTFLSPVVVSSKTTESGKNLSCSNNSPGVQDAKAKAKAAMEAIKLDCKAPKPELPPSDMLESLENDALASTELSAADTKQPFKNQLKATSSIVKDNNLFIPASEIMVSAHEVSDKTSSNKTALEQTRESDKLLDARGLLVPADQQKGSSELEHKLVNCSSQTNRRNFEDTASSSENRAQKVKVTVVQGSPISRASAFSPIQKPQKAANKLTSKPNFKSVPLISAFQTVKKDVAGDQDKASDSASQNQTVPTTQPHPAFAPIPQIHNSTLGHMSCLRLPNSQTLHSNVGSGVGRVQDVLGSSSRTVLPNLPLKIQLQHDPLTGLFYVLPADLHLSPVIQQGSSVVSQSSPVVSQGSPVISQGSPVISHGSSVVSQGSPVISQGFPVVSHGSSVVSQGSPVISQGSPVVSQGSPVISQGSPVVSHGSSVVSQRSPVISQGSPVVSHSSSHILQGSPVISQGSSVVSQGSPVVSKGPSSLGSSAVALETSSSAQKLNVPQVPTVSTSSTSSVAASAGFHPVNSSPSAVNQTNSQSKTSAALNSRGSNHSHSRQKTPGASSDEASTYIHVIPETHEKDPARLKREQMKKRYDKTKHLLSTSKRSLANGATNRTSESESSDSSYFETFNAKSSPKILHRKGNKTTSSIDNLEQDGKKNHGHRKLQDLSGSDKFYNSKMQSKTCKRPTASYTLQNESDTAESSSKTVEKPGTKPRNNTKSRVSHKPKDHHSRRLNLTADDIDDTRPLDFSINHAISPVSMSSLSRDSGVNLHYNISSGDELTTLSEVHLADALQGNATLKKVIKLIRQTFAFDGYLENGVEDLAMAEYITSLSKLTWLTFNNAISEKFFDLYWEEELLEDLYEAVNGQKPPSPVVETSNKQRMDPPQKPPRTKSSIVCLSSTNLESSPIVKNTWSKDSHIHTEESRKTSALTESKTRTELDKSSKGTQDTGCSHEIENTSEKRTCFKHMLENTHDVKKSSCTKSNRAVLKSETCGNDNRTKSSPVGRLTNQIKHSKQDGSCTSSRDSPKLVEKHSGEFQLITDRKMGTQTGERNESQKQRTDAVSVESTRTSSKDLPNGTKPCRSENVRGDSTTSQSVADHHKHGPLGVKNGMCNLQTEPHKIRNCEKQQNSEDEFGHTIRPQESSTAELRRSETGSKSDLSFHCTLGVENTSSKPESESLDSASSLSWKSNKSNDSTNHKIQDIPPKTITRYNSRGSLGSASSGNSRSHLNNSDSISLPSMSSLSGSLDESRLGLASGVMYRGESIDPSVEAYTQQLAGPGGIQQNIEAKIADIDQQLMLEKRMRTKTEKFYNKLLNNQTSKGADNKTMMSKVGKQIAEMSKRIDFLESSKKYLEMLYAEQWGLDMCYLHSLAVSSDKTALNLQPTDDNPLLAFHTSRTKVSLQAGQPSGLLSFLYARHALVKGYLHHFFYTYRYHTTSQDLFRFIADKFVSAVGMSGQNSENRQKIICRTLDILQVWIEGFFEVDLKHNGKLLQDILDFISEKILSVESNGQCLVQLIEKCQQDQPGTSLLIAGHGDNLRNRLIPTDIPVFPSKVPKSQTGVSGRGGLKANIMSCILKKDQSKYSETTYLPAVSIENDGFSLSDHTSMGVAHQLTLLQQELFHRIHPVQYLDSRSKGIGVNTNNYDMTGGKGYTQTSGDKTPSLFVAPLDEDSPVRALLDHARDVSHWVSAEIVSCSSTKIQLALLCKFINVAKACYDLRNFATCIQILDSLESLIVRQLPAWRTLPTKVALMYEDLCANKITLQGDSEILTRDDIYKSAPTLPATLLFLMHVQQLEIGNFKLANGMYKWTKLKSIAKFVDQIRVFKEHAYSFDCDHEFEGLLRHRILECCDKDIHVLAARHSSNYHTLPVDKSSSRRLQNALQKVRATLH